MHVTIGARFGSVATFLHFQVYTSQIRMQAQVLPFSGSEPFWAALQKNIMEGNERERDVVTAQWITRAYSSFEQIL